MYTLHPNTVCAEYHSIYPNITDFTEGMYKVPPPPPHPLRQFLKV